MNSSQNVKTSTSERKNKNGSTNFSASGPNYAARSLDTFQRDLDFTYGDSRSELWECMCSKPPVLQFHLQWRPNLPGTMPGGIRLLSDNLPWRDLSPGQERRFDSEQGSVAIHSVTGVMYITNKVHRARGNISSSAKGVCYANRLVIGDRKSVV